jgi:hypothetical protein
MQHALDFIAEAGEFGSLASEDTANVDIRRWSRVHGA